MLWIIIGGDFILDAFHYRRAMIHTIITTIILVIEVTYYYFIAITLRCLLYY